MINTPRLTLRHWRSSDLEPFASMNQDSNVMRYFPRVLTHAESQAAIERYQTSIDAEGFGFYAVELKETSDFIGFVGAMRTRAELPLTPSVEVGWRLDSAWWGKGFATEAAIAVRDDCFTRLGLDEIIAITPTTNLPSQNVMVKLGMLKHDSTFNHPLVPAGHVLAPHVLYRLECGFWQTLKSHPSNQ